jgi:catalase (peroxidase I)
MRRSLSCGRRASTASSSSPAREHAEPFTPQVHEGRDRSTGELKWIATAVDLVFGSKDQLRRIAKLHPYGYRRRYVSTLAVTILASM